jgi:thioredoxin 1
MNATQVGFNPDYAAEPPTFEQVSALTGFAIIEFGTAWCGHCKASWPAVKDVLTDLQILHIKVEDGKGKLLGRQFQVTLWPTLILLHCGKEIARLVRPLDVTEVREFLSNIE